MAAMPTSWYICTHTHTHTHAHPHTYTPTQDSLQQEVWFTEVDEVIICYTHPHTHTHSHTHTHPLTHTHTPTHTRLTAAGNPIHWGWWGSPTSSLWGHSPGPPSTWAASAGGKLRPKWWPCAMLENRHWESQREPHRACGGGSLNAEMCMCVCVWVCECVCVCERERERERERG